jgi:eukaryotic-like serine/threonine-protein kinase
MSLAPGARIGIFQIVNKIGAGGMGEVYIARDTRLDRDVALKVLPELFTSDPERLARFEREAKVLASLNHQNIAQVYGFEGNAIAMELVDGQTLEEIVSGSGCRVQGAGFNGLPLDRALPIMRQIAMALEAAHDQGIIHRDLKPANVKVRDDGTVKVLDFGLAKAFAADSETAASSVSNSPTLTARSTQLGMILGTAAYMAPEQAKGKPVDRRADVWAFGVVFFEMLAGRRAFDGDDVSDVLASVLKTDPQWDALPADLPGPVRRLLRRCLEKDPKKRLRDIGEGMLQLEEGLASGSTSSIMMPASGEAAASASSSPPMPMWRRALPIAGAVLFTAGASAGITKWMAPPPKDPPTAIRFQHEIPSSSPMWFSIDAHDLAISPNGKTIVFSAQEGGKAPSLWLRRLDQVDGVQLLGAEMASNPFVSPDSLWVGYVDTADGSIKKISILGGPSTPVTKLPSRVAGAAWLSDGSIILGMNGGPLQRASEAGGDPVPLTKLDDREVAHLWPADVPGTSVLLFVTAYGPTPALAGRLAAFDRASGRTARFDLVGVHPRYLPTGHIVFASGDGTLRAVGFDPKTMELSGNPVPVLEGVGVKPFGAANFDVSTEGVLVYASGTGLSATRTITWVSRAGVETAIPAEPRNYYYARIAPDGSRLTLDTRDQEQDIWIWDLRRDDLNRLTDKPGSEQYGLWAAGGQRVVFSSDSTGKNEIYQMRPDGTGQVEQLTDTAKEKLTPFPNAVTTDGKQIIFRAASGVRKNDLWITSASGDRSVRTLLATEHDERNATLSPDGKWMAYESDQSGRFEVYVRPFPDVDAGRFPLSTAGGEEPVWSPTGKEIFYVAGDKMMAVPVSTVGGFVAQKPMVLFNTKPYFFGGQGRNYDVSRDGQRFVMVKSPVDTSGRAAPISIVLNWAEELRAKLK